MNPRFAQFAQGVMAGEEKGAGAMVLRAAMAMGEPFYGGAMRARNWLYESRILKMHRLGRPVISVGNATTGGTGKTPAVKWLAERLRNEGKRVGILSRGYRSELGEMGDELTMLDRALNEGTRPAVFLQANADRVAGAAALLGKHPEIEVLLLDDAFQHRRAGRDLDIVLVSAVNPFGFGHVLPRGLLREPLSGLSRAGAIIITHADQRPSEQVEEIEQEVRGNNAGAPIYRAIHAQVGLMDESQSYPMEALSGRRYFVFCGLGNPGAFEGPLGKFGPAAGRRSFGDHHDYSEADLLALDREARTAGAKVLVTTEKDAVKIEPAKLPRQCLPIWRVKMELRFQRDDEVRLLGQVRDVLQTRA